MEGPILFLTLNRLSKDSSLLIRKIDKLFLTVLIINLIIVFLLDLPEFLITGNPDVISGSYGNNTYQFSMLLLICGGYLLGYNYIKKYRTWIIIASQLLILMVFYLSQFRAGLPFFILGYIFMIFYIYGKRIVYKLIPIFLLAVIFSAVFSFFITKEKKLEDLKFDDWIDVVSEPARYLNYGKFKIYRNIPIMWADEPQIFLIGTGPGNFMSRANYAFSYELLNYKKGVAIVMQDLLGISYPYFTDLHNKYIKNNIKPESVFGTWQFSNPYTSYLAAISEIGVIGGVSIIILYFFIILKSIEFFKIIKEKNKQYIPLGAALIGSTIYLFGLAFLDNYWEIARVTLPVWLLFWVVKSAAYSESS
ncbi:MAG: hypothetical protein ACOYN6_02730 [Ignavibacteria bacterium]